MHIVKIGDQIWSLENSKIKKYSSGDDIHHSTVTSEGIRSFFLWK